MFSKIFWKDAAERAIKTFAQVIISLVAVAVPVSGFELLEVSWMPVLLTALVASALSILMSLASSLKGDSNSASLVNK